MKKAVSMLLSAVCLLFLFSGSAFAYSSKMVTDADLDFQYFEQLFSDAFESNKTFLQANPGSLRSIDISFYPKELKVVLTGSEFQTELKKAEWTSVKPEDQMSMALMLCTQIGDEKKKSYQIRLHGVLADDQSWQIEDAEDAAEFINAARAEPEIWLNNAAFGYHNDQVTEADLVYQVFDRLLQDTCTFDGTYLQYTSNPLDTLSISLYLTSRKVVLSGMDSQSQRRQKVWYSIEPKKQLAFAEQVSNEFKDEYQNILQIRIYGLDGAKAFSISDAETAGHFCERMKTDPDGWVEKYITSFITNQSDADEEPQEKLFFAPANLNLFSLSGGDWVSTEKYRKFFATTLMMNFAENYLIIENEKLSSALFPARVGKSREDNSVYLYFASGSHECILNYVSGEEIGVPFSGFCNVCSYKKSHNTDPEKNLQYKVLIERNCDEVYTVKSEELLNTLKALLQNNKSHISGAGKNNEGLYSLDGNKAEISIPQSYKAIRFPLNSNSESVLLCSSKGDVKSGILFCSVNWDQKSNDAALLKSKPEDFKDLMTDDNSAQGESYFDSFKKNIEYETEFYPAYDLVAVRKSANLGKNNVFDEDDVRYNALCFYENGYRIEIYFLKSGVSSQRADEAFFEIVSPILGSDKPIAEIPVKIDGSDYYELDSDNFNKVCRRDRCIGIHIKTEGEIVAVEGKTAVLTLLGPHEICIAANKTYTVGNLVSCQGVITGFVKFKGKSIPKVECSASELHHFRMLERGDHSVEVSRMKFRLQELGYYWPSVVITPDYNFACYLRVKRFQSQNGLSRTGKADEKTLELLFSDQAKKYKYKE